MFGSMLQMNYLANPGGRPPVFGGYNYSMGGYTTGRINTIKKYILSSGAVSTSSNTLNAAYDQVCAYANGTTGVAQGGSNGSPVNTNSLFALSSETKSAGTALTTSTRSGKGTSSSSYGYVVGGLTSAVTNNILKYNYSGNSWSTLSGALGYATPIFQFGVHCNDTFAVVNGGMNDALTTISNVVKTLTFSSDTVATAGYSLSQNWAQIACTGNQDKYILMGGFYNTSATLTTAVKAITFTTGSTVTATALTYGYRYGDAAGDDANGIFAGAYTIGGGTIANTNRNYTYSSDTYAQTSNSIYTSATDTAAAFNSVQTS